MTDKVKTSISKRDNATTKKIMKNRQRKKHHTETLEYLPHCQDEFISFSGKSYARRNTRERTTKEWSKIVIWWWSPFSCQTQTMTTSTTKAVAFLSSLKCVCRKSWEKKTKTQLKVRIFTFHSIWKNTSCVAKKKKLRKIMQLKALHWLFFVSQESFYCDRRRI